MFSFVVQVTDLFVGIFSFALVTCHQQSGPYHQVVTSELLSKQPLQHSVHAISAHNVILKFHGPDRLWLIDEFLQPGEVFRGGYFLISKATADGH